MTTVPSEYGPLSDIVTYAGYIIAASIAVGLAWRRRSNWEPAEEDLSKGPQKVGALVVGISIVLIWARYHDDRGADSLRNLTIGATVATLLALLVYLFLIGTMTYIKVVVVSGVPSEAKTIGGYRLTPGAKERLRQNPDLTIQELYKGAAYDPDRVWTIASRAAAKISFVVAYLALTIFGSLALAGAAIILSDAAVLAS